MTDRLLVVLSVSPWSERVRWALDHHGLAYRTVEHAPFIGERRLRKLVGPRVLRATVPVLREGPLVITDSTDIARHAERHGSGTPLFPAGRDDDVHHWIGVADAAAAGGRALVTAGLLASPGALDETLPPQVPLWVRPLLRPVTRHGTRWFARKYTLDLNNRAGALDVMRRGLDALRVALPTADSMLLGTFSYADIAVTTVLQGIKPVEHARYPLAPHTRAVWTVPELVAEYPDLLAWRDALYQRHR